MNKVVGGLGWVVSTACLIVIVIGLVKTDQPPRPPEGKGGFVVNKELVSAVKKEMPSDKELSEEIQASLVASNEYVDKIVINPTLETNEIVEIVGEIKEVLRGGSDKALSDSLELLNLVRTNSVSSIATMRYRQKLQKAIALKKEEVQIEFFDSVIELEEKVKKFDDSENFPDEDFSGELADLEQRYRDLMIRDISWSQKIEAMKSKFQRLVFERDARAIFEDAEKLVSGEEYSVEKSSELLGRLSDLKQSARSNYLHGSEISNQLESIEKTLGALQLYHKRLEMGYAIEAVTALENGRLLQLNSPLISREKLDELCSKPLNQKNEQGVGSLESWTGKANEFVSNVFKLSESDNHSAEILNDLLLQGGALIAERPDNRGAIVQFHEKRVNYGIDALEVWIRYNELIKSGFMEEAKEALRDLDPSRYETPFITKERYENLRNKEDPDEVSTLGMVADILETTKPVTADSIGQAVVEIEKISNDNASKYTKPKIEAHLRSLGVALTSLKSGTSPSASLDVIIDFPAVSDTRCSAGLKEVLENVLFQACRKQFDPEENLSPKAEEEAFDYANRLASESGADISVDAMAEKNEELILVKHIADIYDYELPEWIKNEIQVIRYFTAATRGQITGDYTYALRNYRLVLYQDETRFPVDEEIKKRIAEIEANKPQALSQDMDTFIREISALRATTASLSSRISTLVNENRNLKSRIESMKR